LEKEWGEDVKKRSMRNYKISRYSFERAKKLRVQIKPSQNKNKKIDVFKNNIKIASIGAKGYADYPTWIKLKGKEYANVRRRLYKKRHSLDRKSGNGYWADKILW
jgi:hypothetical protein